MTINANAAGHDMIIGAGGVLEKAPSTFSPPDVSGLWSWAYAGDNDENLTTSTISGGVVVYDEIVNLASPGTNNFVNNEVADERHFRPVYSAPPISVDSGAYTAPEANLLRPFQGRQFMRQASNMGATGEFYVIFAAYMERTSGNRYFAGNVSDGVKLNTDAGSVVLVINSTDITLTATSTVSNGVIAEVWRDGSNNLHCWVNGSDVTNGTPSSTATFAFSGFGGAGAGNSEGDDWLFEQIAYNALPTVSERLDLRNYVNNRWSLY